MRRQCRVNLNKIWSLIMKTYGVRYNGKFGVVKDSDQDKAFRCPCCGNKVSKEGKVVVRPTDEYYDDGNDGKKVLVDQDDIKVQTIL